jgi:virulence factor Mce-like protein
MRRVAVIVCVLAAAGAFVVLTAGAGDSSDKPEYTVQFDNAFGLIKGGDVKVAGVRAGKISDLKLDKKTKKALVGIKITKSGFGSFRDDVHCEIRPQSLIGEYFVDCLPGTSARPLRGKTVPVAHTGSTIAPDLVNDILRLPYRERLRIILDDLGTALAGRGGDLNDAIRRASPALRETDKVLAILARQNQVIKNLTRNGDEVITALSNNRKDVGRWVKEAKDTAQASAERRVALAQTWAKLPGFLEQLRPAMRELGAVADEQTPALRNLNASADQLNRLFKNLKPFSNASLTSFRSLGQASVTGRQAVKAAGPTVDQLAALAKGAPELGKNLAIVLEHLDDPKHAVEKDTRAPNGQGFSGLQSLLWYVINQDLAINIFDGNAYVLKASLFGGTPCDDWADPARARDPETKDCPSILGPNQPGVTTPDPTKPAGSRDAKDESHKRSAKHHEAAAPDHRDNGNGGDQGGGSSGGGGPSAGGGGGSTPAPPIDLDQTLNQIFGGKVPDAPNVPPPPSSVTDAVGGGKLPVGGRSADQVQLLDYLLAP